MQKRKLYYLIFGCYVSVQDPEAHDEMLSLQPAYPHPSIDIVALMLKLLQRSHSLALDVYIATTMANLAAEEKNRPRIIEQVCASLTHSRRTVSSV